MKITLKAVAQFVTKSHVRRCRIRHDGAPPFLDIPYGTGNRWMHQGFIFGNARLSRANCPCIGPDNPAKADFIHDALIGGERSEVFKLTLSEAIYGKAA